MLWVLGLSTNGDEVQAAGSGHLFIEQHDAVRLPPEQYQRIFAVGDALDGKALLFQEKHLGIEGFDLVVNPEDTARSGHDSK